MGYCLLVKIWVKILVKIFVKLYLKNLSSKHNQKYLDHAKQSGTDAVKIASKGTPEKTTKATGDLIDIEITNKITKASGNSPQNKSDTVTNEIQSIKLDREIPKERDISRTKTENYWWS